MDGTIQPGWTAGFIVISCLFGTSILVLLGMVLFYAFQRLCGITRPANARRLSDEEYARKVDDLLNDIQLCVTSTPSSVPSNISDITDTSHTPMSPPNPTPTTSFIQSQKISQVIIETGDNLDELVGRIVDDDPNEVEPCPICLEPMDNEGKLQRLIENCKHEYHQDCIDNWILEYNATCPVCKQLVICRSENVLKRLKLKQTLRGDGKLMIKICERKQRQDGGGIRRRLDLTETWLQMVTPRTPPPP